MNSSHNNKNVRRGGGAAKTALAGMLSALSVAIMFIGCATGVMDLTAVTVASLFSMIAVAELGVTYGIGVWVAVSLLSFLLLPDKFVFAEYAFFGGIYPILKLYLERIRNRVAEWTAKIAYAAAVVALLLVTEIFILKLPCEAWYLYAGFAGGFLLFFAVYDLALSRAITLYIRNIRPKLTFLRRLR